MLIHGFCLINLVQMGLYTKIDKLLDVYYEIVSNNKRLSKQNFCLKVILLLFFILFVFMIINCFI